MTEVDVPALAELLHETSERHDAFEKTHAKHDWWDWYAAYLASRLRGADAEAATAEADRYLEEELKVSGL